MNLLDFLSVADKNLSIFVVKGSYSFTGTVDYFFNQDRRFYYDSITEITMHYDVLKIVLE
jgi:hypothetical protein